ncbi:YoaK family protein [uncultured Nocardioides sp.]|uniref:DUF1275 family protein n=1 Tax=uncultured Nocardioides sp. TaxID=198441 RepID=UPI00261FCCA2|nr:YoaK family protein [uncultured Nocardioides sp.]
MGALPLVLALTFATGVVDAVGFLGLDRVFVGNMTGNVVVLGMGLAGADDLPVVGPALALVGFALGAFVGGRLVRGSGWSRRTAVLVGVTGVVVAATAVLVLLAGDDPAYGVTVGTTTALGAAMGLQAATARAVGVKDVTTVVVTSTITGLFADAGRSGSWRDAGRRSTAVVLMLLGALVGALLLLVHAAAGLALAAAVTLVVAVLGLWPARRTSPNAVGATG